MPNDQHMEGEDNDRSSNFQQKAKHTLLFHTYKISVIFRTKKQIKDIKSTTSHTFEIHQFFKISTYQTHLIEFIKEVQFPNKRVDRFQDGSTINKVFSTPSSITPESTIRLQRNQITTTFPSPNPFLIPNEHTANNNSALNQNSPTLFTFAAKPSILSLHLTLIRKILRCCSIWTSIH